ncbi:MAG TPA: hypothetical protein VH107_13060 [Lacipirellulaceae bacterium]|jgi:hypothetical protein|nr:hypothetical protein [Lacipirellulaceae bacterium]
MLNALISLATAGISEAGSFDIAGFNVVHQHAANPLMTPEEPTTLALAAVGAGLIAAYAVVKRIQRQQVPAATILTTSGRQIAPQRSKRGAA